MITLKNVSKYYYNKGIIASGFTKVNLKLNLGEFVAITGESGSGKSTLLNVISGLDTYEEGEMYVDNNETSHYTEVDFEKYRKKYISNIFQNFNLINSYTVRQNIELVLLFNGEYGKSVRDKTLDLIKKVGLTKYKNTKVSKLSGGQKQRVAIARALAKDTPIIIADEPTGSLDSRSAKGILSLLHDLSHDKLVIVVTHNYEQIAPYVTRKITMHDGRILEDKRLVVVDKVNYSNNNLNKSITLFNQFRIGFRNTFNIFPKFLLVLMVYLFIVFAVTSVDAFFKKQEYETVKTEGYNQFFTDVNDTRLIVKKSDKSLFTDDDYSFISSMKHVGVLEKNDLLLDINTFLSDYENLYFSGISKDISNFKGKVVIGRMPGADNEILLVGPRDDDYLDDIKDSIIDLNVALGIDGANETDKKYKIVGIAYADDDEMNALYTNGNDGYIYGSSKMIEELQFKMNEYYSELQVFFNNQYHDSSLLGSNYRIVPTDRVLEGGAFVTDEWNINCKNNNCLNEPMTILVKNLYYEDKIDVKVSNIYTSKNMNSLLGVSDYDQFTGAIYINRNDYNKLFSHGNYQSSVFVDDVRNVDKVASNLEKNGYSVLKIRDTMATIDVVQILKIVRTMVLVVLVMALFFISYFVIRIILKSRNVYFGIIRILGASKNNAKTLLQIELLTVSNLAYILFMFLIYLHRNKIVTIDFLNTIIRYFTTKEYVILYVVITVMSYLISVRFARKIFKNSAMNTMREEV